MPRDRLFGTVVAVGVGSEVSRVLCAGIGGRADWSELAGEEQLGALLDDGLVHTDTLLLGPDVEQPVSIAQRVHRVDKTIPILILSDPCNHSGLQRTITFSPFLGSEVTPWASTDLEGLPAVLLAAVERRRQRRDYLSTIASAQVRLGRLSLFQPEVTHYLGRLLDQAPIGVVSLNAVGLITSLNRYAAEIFGMTEAETLGKELVSVVCAGERGRLADLIVRGLADSDGEAPEVYEVAGTNGGRFIEATAGPLRYHGGQHGLMVILQEVTERVRAERERLRTEAHMRQLSGALEQAADSVVITDKDGIIEYVNPAFEQLTGYAKEEVIGRKTSVSRSGVQDEGFYDELWTAIKGGQVFRSVLVNRRKDGSTYYEDKTISPLRDGSGAITHFIATGHDVTERRKAEESARLHQAELAHVARLSTLGEMTSGLAHELNQPLCAITTYAQTCLRIIRSGDCGPEKVRYGLEQVVKQAELAGAIFRRLREFARKGDFVRRKVNVRHVVREVASLIRAELVHHQVVLRIEGRGSLPEVQADPIQIEQVILNLVRNSMDAMAGNDAANKRLVIRTARSGRNAVKVSITDTGHGCPADIVERLFEPFFTTKPTGLGIGLGISQTIIEVHGGRLWLDANGENGATFSFTLPLREGNHDAGD